MSANASLWLPPSAAPDTDNCSDYTAAWLWLSSLQPAYLGLVTLLGLLGNGLVLCVFCLQRKPCSVADVYLGNLAAADLVMLCCLPFWTVTVARGYRWDFGEAMCKLVNVAISMNYICSMMFLTLVSVDRYLALVKPVSPSRLRRAPWAKRICLGIWVLGLLFTLPSLLFRTVSYVEDAGVHACILRFPRPEWTLYNNITQTVLGFLIPGLAVAYCTCYIVAALNERGLEGLPGVRAERKATHLVLAVLVVFLICWTPHHVMRLLDTVDYFQVVPGCLWGHVLDVGLQLSSYLAYSNSAVNPFLFVIVGTHFRRRAREVFGKTLNPLSKDLNYLSVSFTSVHRLKDVQRLSISPVDIFSIKQTENR
ncbi:B2 bradykinin receptor [Salarias fasciatus]|uniref:B2 bradykinin receptor n=1 Tax=Salarias fasciatus TaxID=181472 RepID=UPI001176F8C3|nr:B2 bradykinin receptor-like [Salarias fasciatus]